MTSPGNVRQPSPALVRLPPTAAVTLIDGGTADVTSRRQQASHPNVSGWSGSDQSDDSVAAVND